MVYRRTPNMTPEQKATILLGLRADMRRVEEEEETLRANVAAALELGLTMAEIGKGLGKGSSTIGRWAQRAA